MSKQDTSQLMHGRGSSWAGLTVLGIALSLFGVMALSDNPDLIGMALLLPWILTGIHLMMTKVSDDKSSHSTSTPARRLVEDFVNLCLRIMVYLSIFVLCALIYIFVASSIMGDDL